MATQSHLTPEQARDLRRNLENSINQLIEIFQRQTGAEIDRIDMLNPRTVGGKYTVISIKASIPL
jgi:hypothetical protein